MSVHTPTRQRSSTPAHGMDALLHRGRIKHVLLQEGGHLGLQANRFVQRRVRSTHVGPHLHQVPALLVARIHRAKAPCQIKVLAGHHVVHDPGRRLLDVDGREMPRFSQGTRQDDVPVENGTSSIGDRILLVVALRQHGVERK